MHVQQGIKKLCCLSVCGPKNIENTNNLLIYVVIRSEKGTITFELFFEGHSADSAIYDL